MATYSETFWSFLILSIIFSTRVYRVSWHADGVSKNKKLSFISYCTSYLSQITIDCSIDQSPTTPRSLPNHSMIVPWYAEAVLSKLFLASEAVNLNPTPKKAFPASVPSSVNEPKTLAHWIFIRLNFQPQPTKLSASSAEYRETF